jgi:hypothetical protein
VQGDRLFAYDLTAIVNVRLRERELCCLPRVQIRRNKRQGFVGTGTIFIILLVLALLSGRGDWLFDGTGYYGGGGIGLLLVIILVVLGRI